MDETALPHASRVSLDRAASLDGRRSLSLDMLTALDDVDLEGGPCEEMASKTSSGAASKEGATGAPAPGSGRDGSIDEATATSAAAVPLSLEWRQLSAFVRVPDLSAQRRRCAALRSTPTKRRQILFGVSGSIEPGVMLGVLGPSGSGMCSGACVTRSSAQCARKLLTCVACLCAAGKTSLLSILGRRSDAEVTGSILVRTCVVCNRPVSLSPLLRARVHSAAAKHATRIARVCLLCGACVALCTFTATRARRFASTRICGVPEWRCASRR